MINFKSERLAIIGNPRITVIAAIICGVSFLFSSYPIFKQLKNPLGMTAAPYITVSGEPSGHSMLMKNIFNAGFFGSKPKGGSSNGASLAQLHGTFAGSGNTPSYAIIAGDSQPEKNYHIGDRLADGSEISAIYADHVLIKANGGEQALQLKEK